MSRTQDLTLIFADVERDTSQSAAFQAELAERRAERQRAKETKARLNALARRKAKAGRLTFNLAT